MNRISCREGINSDTFAVFHFENVIMKALK